MKEDGGPKLEQLIQEVNEDKSTGFKHEMQQSVIKAKAKV